MAIKPADPRRVVTVGMMTTGYDCTDLLNLALLRLFSPQRIFIQMKGRGTRQLHLRYRHAHSYLARTLMIEKTNFKLFDFFANYEYFENEFSYDEVLDLPKEGRAPSSHQSRPRGNHCPFMKAKYRIPCTRFPTSHRYGRHERSTASSSKTFQPILEDQELSNAVAIAPVGPRRASCCATTTQQTRGLRHHRKADARRWLGPPSDLEEVLMRNFD
jgi:superfamily II DNA or RNA helicase